MTRKWTEEDTRWLKANCERMDLQTLSHELGAPLAEVEKRLKQIRSAGHDDRGASVKAPSTVKEAVREISAARREYEKAIEVFHRRDLEDAARRFEALIEAHPTEKEIVDRSRMYVAACRNGKKRSTTPSEPDELFHAAVFEKNRGNFPRALELLKKANGRKDEDGRMHYLAACCHALAGEADEALASLKKAIAASDQNRIQARLDSDLLSLRANPAFSEAVAGA